MAYAKFKLLYTCSYIYIMCTYTLLLEYNVQDIHKTYVALTYIMFKFRPYTGADARKDDCLLWNYFILFVFIIFCKKYFNLIGWLSSGEGSGGAKIFMILWKSVPVQHYSWIKYSKYASVRIRLLIIYKRFINI